ncbi:filamentous hemagglutinin-like protein [Pusillimonas sp. T7-7]|nr:filamentous hemagglutinin-like protein [Pusillimonas sp. T7-7]
MPSSGAGIATLASVAEVSPGNVDLIAPLGVIDAGEAGIRVSGDVNLAALQIVNADNIQVQGESVGMPAVVAVNVGALTSASAASSAAAGAAQDSVSRARAEARQNQPSIFSVRILGFGNESASSGGGGSTASVPAGGGARGVSYQPGGMVQVVSDASLTPAERQSFGL